jgi:hypothetical protein
MKAKVILAVGLCVLCLGLLVLEEARLKAHEGKHRAEVTALRTQVSDLQNRLHAVEARLAEADERTRVVVRRLAEPPPAWSESTQPTRNSVLTLPAPGSRPSNALEEFDMNGQKFYLTPLANQR